MTKKISEPVLPVKTVIQAVEEFKPQAEKGFDFANRLIIKSQKDLEIGKLFLQKIGVFKKEVSAKKDSIVKPLNEALKNAKALFAPIENQISETEMKVKGQMLTYNQKVQRELAEKEALAVKAVEAGEITQEKAEVKIERAQAKVEAIPTRKISKLVIFDTNLIPDEYWVIDEVKLRSAALNAKQNGQEIPGAKIVIEEIIVNS